MWCGLGLFVFCFVSVFFQDGLNTDMTRKSCFSHFGIAAIPVVFLMKCGQDRTFCSDCCSQPENRKMFLKVA